MTEEDFKQQMLEFGGFYGVGSLYNQENEHLNAIRKRMGELEAELDVEMKRISDEKGWMKNDENGWVKSGVSHEKYDAAKKEYDNLFERNRVLLDCATNEIGQNFYLTGILWAANTQEGFSLSGGFMFFIQKDEAERVRFSELIDFSQIRIPFLMVGRMKRISIKEARELHAKFFSPQKHPA